MADDVFETEIRPLLFDGIQTGQEHPEFILLAGMTRDLPDPASWVRC